MFLCAPRVRFIIQLQRVRFCYINESNRLSLCGLFHYYLICFHSGGGLYAYYIAAGAVNAAYAVAEYTCLQSAHTVYGSLVKFTCQIYVTTNNMQHTRLTACRVRYSGP